MKTTLLLILISILYISCNKEEIIQDDIAFGVNRIEVKSTSYKLPLNEYGVAVFTCTTDLGSEITNVSSFYVDGIKIEQNIFRPSATGSYTIQSEYKNLKSSPIEIKVEEPLNKKVLIESFTSRICGFCPWISWRLDSLQKSNNKVNIYSIHGQDELEVNGTPILQEYLQVVNRPAVRIQRGYVRNYDAPIEIKELIDSVNYFLSVQPKLEISIQSSLVQNSLSINVFSKYYEKINDTIYLTLVLVEDSVVTQNQYNYFSGYTNYGGHFIALPNLLDDYNNHNVLRNFLTDPKGDEINTTEFEYNISSQIGSFEIQLENLMNLHNFYIIAIVHSRRNGIEVSSVLNSQMVKAGEVVGFNE